MTNRLPNISTLIDGYNLMLGSVVSPDAKRKRTLHDARLYFLSWLESKLPPQERTNVCIVFDTAHNAAHDQQTAFHGMRIIYATSHLSADECIQSLIRNHPSPSKLTVVSSDHQIQRNARARGAKAIDSEVWIEQLNAPPTDKERDQPAGLNDSEKPDREINTKKWLEEFGF
ncbi:NYN domain-containing protein [Pirellulaceae bacterium SH449]